MNNPAPLPISYHLTGHVLKGGWKVTRRLPRPGEQGAENATGGNFSVCYVCEKEGKTGFLKVFDIMSATQAPDFMAELQKISGRFNHEAALLKVCADEKLSRIVRGVETDTLQIAAPEFNNLKIPLCYIIFEQADGGDIRNMITRIGAIEDAAKLTMLHQVAVAIQQLHTVNIAHQDMKPSNVLLFEKSGEGAKLADLGRASLRGRDSEHDGYSVAGDSTYAPPEQLYGYKPADWHERREACDLYQFGSLLCYLFAARCATAGIFSYVSREYWPQYWRGTYADVLPFLQQGFAHFLEEVAVHLPEWGREKLIAIVRQACDPDVHRRGDSKARLQVTHPLGLDRFVSRMSGLKTLAMVEARKAALGSA